jgi:cytochrome c553
MKLLENLSFVRSIFLIRSLFFYLFCLLLLCMVFSYVPFDSAGASDQPQIQISTSPQKTISQSLAAKATACFACHGETGRSPNSIWPNLAGQKAEYLEKQLLSFKKGTRKDPMMNPVAENLSDQQIQEIAQYYSSLMACP